MEMMTGRTLFRNYKEYDQKEVEICGWVKSNRGSKKFGFLVINDGTFFEPIQVVYDQEMGNFDTVSKLNVGTAVIVNGTVIVTPDAKQPFEIHAKSVEVEGECPSDYPLQKKRHTLEYLRSIVVTWNISPAPSQSCPVINGVCTYTKSLSWKN